MCDLRELSFQEKSEVITSVGCIHQRRHLLFPKQAYKVANEKTLSPVLILLIFFASSRKIT
jgi:hypothetical protein